jgi:hypothetical protein
VFQRYRLARFADGDSILSSILAIFDTAPAASKNDAHYKIGQN